MKYFISSDHAGFELKKSLIEKYTELIDLGPKEFIKEDDYPDYAFILSKELLKDIDNNKGILICRNGVGVCIASNKLPKIRAGLSFNEEHLKSMISDDNPNVLCLPADFIKKEEIEKLVGIFLEGEFKPQNRHERRLMKISIIENSKIWYYKLKMIIPAILEENLKDIQNRIDLVSDHCERVQIDVCDGVFVPEETYLDLGKLKTITSRIEYHLMVKNPLKFIDIPLKNSDSVIIHVESNNVKEAIKEFMKKTKKVGVCKNPDTPASEIEKYADMVNFVQFLTVYPGKQGQELLEKPYNEAIEFKNKFPTIPVQIDGGVNEENLKRIVHNKIFNLVVGSAIFNTSSPTTTIKNLNNRIKNMTRKVKVAFLGGSAFQPQDQTFKDTFEVAKLLAKNGYVVVNGGGPGVMRAATLGASAAGRYAQVITYHPNKPKTHYEGIDLDNIFDDEIITLDYFDRTKVMLQTTDIHIVFKGSIGTLSEFGMTWVSSWIHEPNAKPIILYGDFWQEILDVFKKNLLILNNETDLFKICTTPEQVLNYIEKLEFHEKNNGNTKPL